MWLDQSLNNIFIICQEKKHKYITLREEHISFHLAEILQGTILIEQIYYCGKKTTKEVSDFKQENVIADKCFMIKTKVARVSVSP